MRLLPNNSVHKKSDRNSERPSTFGDSSTVIEFRPNLTCSCDRDRRTACSSLTLMPKLNSHDFVPAQLNTWSVVATSIHARLPIEAGALGVSVDVL